MSLAYRCQSRASWIEAPQACFARLSVVNYQRSGFSAPPYNATPGEGAERARGVGALIIISWGGAKSSADDSTGWPSKYLNFIYFFIHFFTGGSDDIPECDHFFYFTGGPVM
ncbi:MAG: hypothetical protein GY762_09795 [Proteobacteria bacterium]|nr:hypothetical protein [Pseudomonadota bacterium]